MHIEAKATGEAMPPRNSGRPSDDEWREANRLVLEGSVVVRRAWSRWMLRKTGRPSIEKCLTQKMLNDTDAAVRRRWWLAELSKEVDDREIETMFGILRTASWAVDRMFMGMMLQARAPSFCAHGRWLHFLQDAFSTLLSREDVPFLSGEELRELCSVVSLGSCQAIAIAWYITTNKKMCELLLEITSHEENAFILFTDGR